MQRIVINMQNYFMGEAVQKTLKSSGDFTVTVAERPSEVPRKCFTAAATILLMEVTGRAPWKLEERMKICDEVKGQNPDCKVVLFVDENAEEHAAEQIKQAKRDRLIDQFFYGSGSASYLAAVLDTL